jgi:hypothetical protein
MTHTQKINKTALLLLLKTFKVLSDSGKTEFLTQFMEQFPEYYPEFVTYIDEKTYNKIVGKA